MSVFPGSRGVPDHGMREDLKQSGLLESDVSKAFGPEGHDGFRE